MSGAAGPKVLILIAGPQAVGKSTIAGALVGELRRSGEVAVLVELDAIAGMALPTLPSWSAASAIFESVVGQWARAAVTAVVAEGAGSCDEVGRLRAQAPADAAVLTVGLSASFATGLDRARADPTRTMSRDPGFLAARYQEWEIEVQRLDPDLRLDTDDLAVEECVAAVRTAADRLRGH